MKCPLCQKEYITSHYMNYCDKCGSSLDEWELSEEEDLNGNDINLIRREDD